MENKLKEFLKQQDYEKAIDIVMNILMNLDRDKVENWIVYKDILVYKQLNKMYHEKFIQPLNRKIREVFSEVEGYLNQVEIINNALEDVYTRLEENFKVYRDGSMLFALYAIIGNSEIFFHNMNAKLNEFANSEQIERNLGIYQENVDRGIDSLNKIVEKIYSEKEAFKDNNSFKDIIEYCDNINKDSRSDLLEIMCELNSTLNVLDMIKKNKARVTGYSRGEFQLYYYTNSFLKYDLPKIRLQQFELICKKKYYKNATSNLKILEGKDVLKFLDINNKTFKLKIDLTSKEFFRNIETIMVDALHYQEFILFENFIDIKKMDNKVKIENQEKLFTFSELILFRIALLGICNFYYVAEEAYFQSKQEHSLTSTICMKKELLKNIISLVCLNCFEIRIEDNAISQLIDYHTYGTSGIYDILCTPLINYENNYILSPSVIMMTNLGRIFIEYLNKFNIELKGGTIFEENFKIMLREHEYKVYEPKKTQLNFTTKNGNKGDIDILAIKDDYIFCIQMKNKPMPLDEKEFVNFDRKLPKALEQLKHAEEFLRENPKDILEFYKVKNLEEFKIVRLTVSNSFYRSGECVNGIYITDMSALNVLFDTGKITIRKDKEVREKNLRRGKKVSAKEFVKFLKEPYFKWKGVYL